MSDQLRDLVLPVGEFEPPLDLHSRIIERERQLAGSHRVSWRPPRVLMLAVAAAGVGLLILALAFAAGSRTSAPGPGNQPHPLRAGVVPCGRGDMAISIELREPQHQNTGAFRTHLHRRVATIVLQNVSNRACSASPAFTFRIFDRLGNTVGGWNDQGSWFYGIYEPGGVKTFSLPAVYHCDRLGPFTAVAHVGRLTARRHGLSLGEITCP